MAKKKILIVDDEIDFTELMKTRLEANDFEVVVANNGESALEMVKTARPDAVLLDIMMPGIDGLTVLKRIRATDERLPIFMITAFSNEEKIKLAGKMNASGFIIKARTDISEEIKHITDAIDVANKYKEKRG